MNAQQNTHYTQIKSGYKTDKRWVACQAIMADPLSSPEDYAWAVLIAAEIERYAAKAAESARIGGL